MQLNYGLFTWVQARTRKRPQPAPTLGCGLIKPPKFELMHPARRRWLLAGRREQFADIHHVEVVLGAAEITGDLHLPLFDDDPVDLLAPQRLQHLPDALARTGAGETRAACAN